MGPSSAVQDFLASQSSARSIATIIVVAYFVYLCGLVIYRLYLSPLAKFPGLKLTAATGWYETYYQLVKGGGGQFTFQISKWHEKYGPMQYSSFLLLPFALNHVLTWFCCRTNRPYQSS